MRPVIPRKSEASRASTAIFSCIASSTPTISAAAMPKSPSVPLPDGHPLPEEWKTPPLWGVADSAPYFHDGGSPTLDAAIRRHEGDAAQRHPDV